MAKAKPTQSTAALAEFVVEEPLLSSQIGQIGGNLTPAVISSILAYADTGNQYRLVDLAHDARQKVSTLHAALALAELSVSQLKWQVKPPPKANRKEKKLAQAFAEAFQSADGRSEMIEHSIGERRLFGHASSEAIWGESNGFLVPVKYKTISCRRFGFRGSDGALVFGGEGNPNNGIELLKEYAAGKFIQARQRINGDVPAREGLARLLVWLAVGCNWSYKDWMMLAELAWKPKRLGKYKRNASTDDIRILKSILRDLMTSGAAAHSEDVEVNLLWPQGSASGGSGSKAVHKELLQWLGAEICKAAIGSADQLEPGENGARAATETRSNNPKVIRDANANSLADCITRQQVVPFTRYNGGERVRPGTFEFITDDPVDLEKFSKAVKNLKDASMRIPEQWASDATNIPIPADGERVLGGVAGKEENPDGAGNSEQKPGAAEQSEDDQSKD